MNRLPAIAACIFAAVTLATPAAAGETRGYSLDPVHTRVLVAVEHAGFSKALGTVSGSQGQLLFDPDDWSTARLEVSVPLQRLDFGDADWNRAVAARNLLDTAHYPLARFTSTSIAAYGERDARLCGELELRGVTRPLCLDVTFNHLARHPLPPYRRTAGFSATATLSRAEFGIDAWRSMIGDRVELRIEAEAIRDYSAERAFADEPLPAAATGSVTDDVTGADADPYQSLQEAADAALQDDDASTLPEPPASDDEPTP